jgi:hypothetical protein
MRGISGLTVFLFLGAAAAPSHARLVDAITGFDASSGAVAALPAKLSLSGLYDNVASKTRAVTEGITPYEINAALWSDGAHKQRWITVPAGTNIAPTDTDHYVFPDKTVLIKNFAIDTIAGDSTSRMIIETRFLVAHKNGANIEWKGISYAWNKEQTDADLVNQITGMAKVFAVRVNGKAVGKRWQYPSRSACAACHLGRGSLGFITPQLNRPSKANAAVNQLADFAAKGLLTKNPLTTSPNAMKWAAYDDAGASIEVRARSWLAANCSHCHGNGNKETLSMPHDFDYLNKGMAFQFDPKGPDAQGGYVDRPAKTGNEEYPYIMKAGHPDSSLAIKRMITRGSPEQTLDNPYDQMPWLATFQPDSGAVRVVADWLCGLGHKPTGAACRIPDVQQPPSPALAIRLARHARYINGAFGMSAFIVAGKLYVQAPLRNTGSGDAAPVLRDAGGKAVPISPAGKDVYALPGELPAGAYFLQWRGQTVPVGAGY